MRTPPWMGVLASDLLHLPDKLAGVVRLYRGPRPARPTGEPGRRLEGPGSETQATIGPLPACPAGEAVRWLGPIPVLLSFLLAAGCHWPGKPDPAQRPVPADKVLDFAVLYEHNC